MIFRTEHRERKATVALVLQVNCHMGGLFVRFSPPDAHGRHQQGGMDGLSRPFVLYPTNDIEISDAQVHKRGARGRQYVVFGAGVR